MPSTSFELGPLTFRPILKRALWGGRRLATILQKPAGQESDYAESWEIADHDADQSVVAGGPFEGWTLSQLVAEYGDALFGRHAGLTQFPLLVKFLDAHDRLSVQVHPDDRMARRLDPKENGKTECWIILDAAPGSIVYAGLKNGVDRALLEDSLSKSRLANCLHVRAVSPGDCVFIPAGTVHAIGEGILLSEVQQSSDLTFRLYDWDRVGPDGKPRLLHVKQALECIDFNRGPVEPAVPRSVVEVNHTAEELVRCEHFVIRRHTTADCFIVPADGRFRIVIAVAGATRIRSGDDELRICLGSTVLIPAVSPPTTIEVERDSAVLEVFVP